MFQNLVKKNALRAPSGFSCLVRTFTCLVRTFTCLVRTFTVQREGKV